MPPLIQRSRDVFQCELGQLLPKYAGRWVAYSGDRRLGIARSQTKLSRQCRRQGLKDDEFIVERIEWGKLVQDWDEFGKIVERLNPPEEPYAPADGQPSLLDLEIPPLVQQGNQAFRRDLPELLEKYHGQWVAYSGDRRLGIGRDKTKLYQQCLRQGLGRGEFVVWGIEPAMPDEIDLGDFRDI